jgi:rRNA maturation RNase YbeY
LARRTRIDFSFRSRSKGIDRELLRKKIARACRIAGLRGGEISLSVVDDSEMRDLNRIYRNINRSTDVLAFAFQEEKGFPHTALIGDVVVSVETARRQARCRNVPLEEEVRDLFIHGICHLLGYDHIGSRRKAVAMKMKEKEIRRILDEGI